MRNDRAWDGVKCHISTGVTGSEGNLLYRWVLYVY